MDIRSFCGNEVLKVLVLITYDVNTETATSVKSD